MSENKTEEPFQTGLTLASRERLALLAEELAETIHVIGKILRHGFDNCHPNGGATNRELLEIELGHVEYALLLMVHAREITMERVGEAAFNKEMHVQKYLHYQEGKTHADH
jgi:hypothetical protein